MTAAKTVFVSFGWVAWFWTAIMLLANVILWTLPGHWAAITHGSISSAIFVAMWVMRAVE